MNHEIDLNKYQVRTDLALDLVDEKEINGIVTDVDYVDDIVITNVKVDDVGSKTISKKKGTYVTIEFDDITDTNNLEMVKKVFSKELKKLIKTLNIKDEDECLIIGLGNHLSTPDALGPMSVEHILVTKHLFLYNQVEDGFRSVAALSPGVMGQTGIETSDIIFSVIKEIKPDFVIVIDALASQAISRVNKTIQMTDTGISPGSGIGNTRKEIDSETLNIPVIAIGVPTVVDAVTIVSDTIEYLYKNFSYTKENIDNPINKLAPSTSINYLKKDIKVDKRDKKELFGIVGDLNEDEIKQLIFEVLTPIGYNFMVTPKEVDFIMQRLANIIGNGINDALHKKVNSM